MSPFGSGMGVDKVGAIILLRSAQSKADFSPVHAIHCEAQQPESS